MDRNNFLIEMESDKIINSSVIKSMVGGAIPIPLLDIAATTAVQVNMVKRLCGLHGIEYRGERNKVLISSLTTSVGAKFGASLVKSIPLIGTILGTPTMISLSGVITYATGKAFLQYTKANKTIKSFHEFDLVDLTEKIKRNLSDGAKYVKETVGKTVNVDLEEKLKDISKGSKEFKNQTLEPSETLFKSDAKWNKWLDSKNKLSGDLTPRDYINSGKTQEVKQWIDILIVMKDENYLDL